MKLSPFAAALALVFAACTTTPAVRNNPGTPASPSVPWVAPAGTLPPPSPPAARTPVLPTGYQPGMPMSLAQVVDIALSNNPQTRIAWLQARAAEAQLGSAQAAYLPEVDLGAEVTRSATGSSTGTAKATTIIGPSLALNYLLFDFGGREASVEQARQALVAADLLHSQAIQDVVLQSEQAYYDYLNSRALLDAQDATIKERQAELDAASARHNAGVATIADVLQARTALSQATLNRETIEGQRRAVEGSLATAMGLPATTTFDFGTLPLEIPVQQVTETVDTLINRAVSDRPDLAAARAEAERAGAHIREVRAAGLPSIGLTSTIGQNFYTSGGKATPYAAGVALRWPVFTGFRNQFDIRQAELEADIARENVHAAEQQIDLQVWTSYYALQTANQRLVTARDLLASAQQSADVARERYRAGVGSILDLLTAESALEAARAQEVQARADWFVSVAQLAHATGSLR